MVLVGLPPYIFNTFWLTLHATDIILIICNLVNGSSPVPVAARSKAYVCGRSPAEIVGSNPTGYIDVFLLWVLCECCVCLCVCVCVCVVRESSLRRADHSSRGVLPTVVCRCVWCRNLLNEEAMAHLWLSRQIDLMDVLLYSFTVMTISIWDPTKKKNPYVWHVITLYLLFTPVCWTDDGLTQFETCSQSQQTENKNCLFTDV